jgi:osmotically-inducible protein OsmY
MKKMQTLAIVVASALALPVAAQMSQPDKNAPAANTTTPSSTASDAKHGAKDAMLTAKVHAAMAKDPGLKTLAINVDSNGNDVTLKGQVDSEATRMKAEQTAKQVEGVGAVHNQLTIKPKG